MPEPLVRTRFDVASGSCLDCAGDLAGALGALPGVERVHLLTTANVVLVEHQRTVPLTRLQQQAARLGVRLVPAGKDHGAPKRWWQQPTLIAVGGSGALLLAGFVVERAFGQPLLATVLYFATLIVGGLFPMRGAIRALRSGRLSISTLLVVAAAGAVVLGVYEEAALLVVVFSLGEVLEVYASARAPARVEAASEHPLAAAIIEAATQRGVRVTPAEHARAVAGSGIEASIDGERWFIGRPREAVLPAVQRELVQRQREGQTAVVLSDGAGRVRAILAIADTTRSQASHAVQELHALGVAPIIMLTGDNEQTAAAVARAVGIDQWRADLLPEDKTGAVQQLRARHGAVAMIGDGVNDAPALAVADVGIAMGAAGTDVARETADVALMADDLEKLPEAIRLARRALANIRQNIALSLASVAVLVIGALAGWFSLTTGLLLNEGSALLIIVNGLRLVAGREPGGRGGQVDAQVACAA